MRKVIYSLSVSLDGFIETPDGKIDWAIIDDEFHMFANDQAREMGIFLYGRSMYELMSSDWPRVHEDTSYPEYMLEFARIWLDKPKIVFSTTLDKVDWNSRLVRGNISETIRDLKAQPGKDMGLGGAGIAASFMRLGLIDEFRLFIHPVVLGGGKSFFPELDEPVNLQLVDTHRFVSGVLYLAYQKAVEGK